MSFVNIPIRDENDLNSASDVNQLMENIREVSGNGTLAPEKTITELLADLTTLTNNFNSHVAKATHYNNQLSEDVAIAVINTWYTGASLVLPAGTYLVTGQITLLRNTTTALTYSAKINDGDTNYASAGIYMPSIANHIATLPLTTMITLTEETTITLQAAATVVSTIKAALVSNPAGNTATQLSAVRIV